MTKEAELAARIGAAIVERIAIDDEEARMRERARARAVDREANPARVQAARLVGEHFEDVTVEATNRGVVISVRGQPDFILVGEDAPDADGRWGLMTTRFLTQYSPWPVYAERPTPAPASVVVEPEAEDVVQGPPMDDRGMLEDLEAELARAEAELAVAMTTDNAFGERVVAQREVAGLKHLVMRRRAAVNDRELRENPPPPRDDDLRLQTAAYWHARAALELKDPNEQAMAVAAAVDYSPQIAGSPRDQFMAMNELAGVKKWFAHHGIELPEVPPWATTWPPS